MTKFALLVVALLGPWLPVPPNLRSVRHIVTFRFLAGKEAEALRIYRDELRPIYQATPIITRFRGYREAESPEPLDVIVVTTYPDLAGMDRANALFRVTPPNGRSVFAMYGALDSMVAGHHDQFVEMIPALSDQVGDSTGIVVFEYLRTAPGRQQAFERHLATTRRSERGLYVWSETGRMLVSDGWDYLRTYGIRSLADWQRYQSRRGTDDRLTSARKTIIVREVTDLRVR
jgi:hypothetical protein